VRRSKCGAILTGQNSTRKEADRALSAQREERGRPHSVRISGGKTPLEACAQSAGSSTFFLTVWSVVFEPGDKSILSGRESISCGLTATLSRTRRT